jgi:hypothetical protein
MTPTITLNARDVRNAPCPSRGSAEIGYLSRRSSHDAKPVLPRARMVH